MSTERAADQPGADAIVGEKIFHNMWRMKLTQTELAKHLGVSQTNVSRRLRGETGWTIDDLLIAARVLQVPVEDLMPGPDYRPNLATPPSGGGTEDAEYAIRDSNPEPADYLSAALTTTHEGVVLPFPRRPSRFSLRRRSGSARPSARGGQVVRLEARASRRTTETWHAQVSS